MRTPKTLSHSKVGNGTYQCIIALGSGSHLLPHAIHSLQSHPGELVRSLWTDDVLTILDEHYNNVKAFHALNQDSFSCAWGKMIQYQTGLCLLRHLQVCVASFPECFPLDHIAKLKHDPFYSGLPKWFKVMVAYLKASNNGKMYSDYLWATKEAEKEEAMEPSHSPNS